MFRVTIKTVPSLVLYHFGLGFVGNNFDMASAKLNVNVDVQVKHPSELIDLYDTLHYVLTAINPIHMKIKVQIVSAQREVSTIEKVSVKNGGT